METKRQMLYTGKHSPPIRPHPPPPPILAVSALRFRSFSESQPGKAAACPVVLVCRVEACVAAAVESRLHSSRCVSADRLDQFLAQRQHSACLEQLVSRLNVFLLKWDFFSIEEAAWKTLPLCNLLVFFHPFLWSFIIYCQKKKDTSFIIAFYFLV